MINSVRLSLSQRLLVGLLTVSLACFAVIAWVTIRDSISETYDLFDAHLAQTALALLRVTDPDDDDLHELPKSGEPPSFQEIFTAWPELPQRLAKTQSSTETPAGPGVTDKRGVDRAGEQVSMKALHAEYEKKLRYQIWTGDGRLLLRSTNAPAKVMTLLDGFSESIDELGQTWRHYGVWDRHDEFRILVSEAHDVRKRLVRNIALRLASPLALGLPVLILLLWLSIGRGLNPLAKLTREIQRRKPDSLAPLDADNTPGELRPMVVALNELLRRVTDALESERRFTANAAHELRTPLAAIQVQSHLVRTAEGEEERLRAMDQLQRGVERGIRLVGQLLTLARLDPELSLPDIQPVNLGEMARSVCAELAPLALQANQLMELQIEPDLPAVPGNADMLSMLLGNILDNAIRYTRQGGRLAVNLQRTPTGVLMTVSDDGPGIPMAQRERVFSRFYRLAAPDQPGTGLGLAICQRIAELHNAQIVLADGLDGRGLSVSVLLKAPSVREAEDLYRGSS